jgi:hypothetical protein
MSRHKSGRKGPQPRRPRVKRKSKHEGMLAWSPTCPCDYCMQPLLRAAAMRAKIRQQEPAWLTAKRQAARPPVIAADDMTIEEIRRLLTLREEAEEHFSLAVARDGP